MNVLVHLNFLIRRLLKLLRNTVIISLLDNTIKKKINSLGMLVEDIILNNILHTI